MYAIKPIGAQTNLATSTTVGNATAVHLTNTTEEGITITIADGATTVSTFTMAPGLPLVILKEPDHTIVANANILALKIAAGMNS